MTSTSEEMPVEFPEEVLRGYVIHHTTAATKNQQREMLATIDRMATDRDRLVAVLGDLLDDSQHAEHPSCEDGQCPVREARELLVKYEEPWWKQHDSI